MWTLSITAAVTASAVVHFAYAAPSAAEVKRSSDKKAASRAADVIQTFRIAWDGYFKNAFPHDQLHPVDNGEDDNFNGWGASAFDALDTAIVMGQTDIVNVIVDYIPTVNLTQSVDSSISLFETTIRYLGGLLSAYDLLKLTRMVSDDSKVEAILDQAKTLGDTLKFAFDTPTGIPHNGLDINTQSTDGSTTNGIATIGTLVLEWTHLSDLTGDPEYGLLAQKGESFLLNPNPSWTQPFPGLIGTNVDLATGLFQDDFVGWVGGDDSFYEYLIKMFVYSPSRFSFYRDRWILAAESTMAHLASHPEPRPDLTFLSIYDNGTFLSISEHLAGFAGGNFLLAGSVLRREDFTKFGLQLVNAWHDTYAEDATGIGPEEFSWDPTQVPADQAAFFNKSGFYLTNAAYILRPEVIESYYYAYRLTGNEMYRDWAWDAFLAINSTCHVGSGYSGIENVNVAGGSGFTNTQETFFFAEVLKYSYLIQAEDAPYQIQRNGHNQFVYNTECHPLRVSF